MKNKFKQRTYKCECGVLTNEYVWDNELETTKVQCSECPNILTYSHLVKEVVKAATSIRTPTKNR